MEHVIKTKFNIDSTVWTIVRQKIYKERECYVCGGNGVTIHIPFEGSSNCKACKGRGIVSTNFYFKDVIVHGVISFIKVTKRRVSYSIRYDEEETLSSEDFVFHDKESAEEFLATLEP